jgi:hypothetical protein
VVIWLMIWQRLRGNVGMAAAVQYLLQNEAAELQGDCRRWAADRVSAATGGYSQARHKLPASIVSNVTERIVGPLRAEMQAGWAGLRRPIFVVDGSSVPLQHAPELVKAFPPGHNQHGENHWPVLRMVVFHDVFSGLALPPANAPCSCGSPRRERKKSWAARYRKRTSPSSGERAFGTGKRIPSCRNRRRCKGG